MPDKRCENGHFIDESWDICPYCPQDASDPAIPVVRPRADAAMPAAHVAPLRAAPDPPPRAALSAAEARPVGRSTSPGPVAVPSAPFVERTVAAQKIDASSAHKRYVVGWLVGLSGIARGESFPVRVGRNIIGRDKRSDISINDDQASSHHADLVFRPEERRFILMDHNSTNGTYVNEMEIEPRRDLAANDIVRVGSHRFLFVPLCHEGFFWDDEGLLK